jgi:hypothetical protein
MPNTLETLRSDFEIVIQDCRWTLYEDSKALANHDTQNGMDSQMYHSLQKLIGKEVTSIDLDERANLTIRFNDQVWIKTDCRNDLSEGQNNHYLSLGELEMNVGPDCIPKLEKREDAS